MKHSTGTAFIFLVRTSWEGEAHSHGQSDTDTRTLDDKLLRNKTGHCVLWQRLFTLSERRINGAATI